MRLLIDVDMTYRLGNDRRVLLDVEVVRLDSQTIHHDQLEIENAVFVRIEGHDGIGTRIWATVDAPILRLHYHADVKIRRSVTVLHDLKTTPLEKLPGEILTYLRPSRYCQSDLFGTFVDRHFGKLSGGAKVLAIRDWLRSELAYSAQATTPETTAVDTFTKRAGVCRDFTHLTCALTRASNIPARYAAVYGYGVEPPDFHAVAQVWLDGAWHLVDATGMCSAEATAIVAVGRDAGDIPFMETVDDAFFISQRINVVERPSNHE